MSDKSNRNEGGRRRLRSGKGVANRYLLLLLVALCGCFEVQDELKIEADGSGSVRIETTSSLPEELLGRADIRGQMEGAVYPPFNENDAKRFFAGKDFAVQAKQEKVGEQTRITVEATFKDINALMESPYGRAHALSLQNENGRLTLKALTGMEVAARLSEMKEEMVREFAPNLGKLDLQKEALKMRAQFRVIMPSLITGGNGARAGNTVTWSFERAKAKDAAEYAQQLGAVLESSCASVGLKLSPRAMPRLALQRFGEMQEAVFTDKGAARDSNQIAAAVKFVPYGLQVTRSLDLSGEGGSQQDQAQLMGAVIVPLEFVPQKWGEVILEEVLDSKGNSLKDSQNRYGPRMPQFERNFDGLGDDGGTGSVSKKAAEQRFRVTLNFRPPDWKVKEIARLKGSVDLTYFGGLHLLKLTNAIPPSALREMKEGRVDFEENESGQRKLAHPKFKELDLALTLQMGMVMGEMTTLMIKTEGKRAGIAEAQVYDNEGKPWPTLLNPEGSGAEDMQLVVAGRPRPPLSLAMLVNGGGVTVQAPIALQNIPITTTPQSKEDPPLESKVPRRTASPRVGEQEELPITEAGPGFLVEALGISTTTVHYFPEGEQSSPGNRGRLGLQIPGAWVRAKLFAPKGRTMRSVSGVRVLKALDDKARAVEPGPDNQQPAGDVRYSPGGRDAASSFIDLRLGLPQADALTIDKLTGEAVAMTVGKWKALTLTNVQENATNVIDLGFMLDGAKLVIAKASCTNQQITIQAKLTGPSAIGWFDVQCKSPGTQNFNSWARDENFTKEGVNATRSINIQCNSYAANPEDRADLSTVQLLIRLPEDLRRERVEFTLTGLDLF